ncbi:MAG: ABC transporter substrate-binding protein, partial [Campylobacteraceae bacterium]|nr:ABC transporter substrate-binding protein [Campylobacteraceae bacterium]
MNKLPKDLQKILTLSMRLAAFDMYTQNYHMSAMAWDKMIKEYPGIKVKSLPKSVMKSLKRVNDELLAKISKDNPFIKETLDSQNSYMKKAREWTKMSDYLYIRDNL